MIRSPPDRHPRLPTRACQLGLEIAPLRLRRPYVVANRFGKHGHALWWYTRNSSLNNEFGFRGVHGGGCSGWCAKSRRVSWWLRVGIHGRNWLWWRRYRVRQCCSLVVLVLGLLRGVVILLWDVWLLLLLLLLVHGKLVQFSKTGLGLVIDFLKLVSKFTLIPVHNHSYSHCNECRNRDRAT